MSIMTLEAIRENPWNVIALPLPARPERILLEAAYLAADYCRRSEALLMNAARTGDYTPRGWNMSDDGPDIHEESEARGDSADRRLAEICALMEKEFGETLEV